MTIPTWKLMLALTVIITALLTAERWFPYFPTAIEDAP